MDEIKKKTSVMDLDQESNDSADNDPLDDWNLDALRLDQSFDSIIGAQPVIVTVSIRKPHPQEWFRIHKDEKWRLVTTILHLKDDRESFLVHPRLRAQLWDEIQLIRLCTAISRQGELFLWPIRMSKIDGKTDRFIETDHATMKEAERYWTRRYWVPEANSHQIKIAKDLLEEPSWPTDVDFETIVGIAFKDRRIKDLDHPALKRLRGEL